MHLVVFSDLHIAHRMIDETIIDNLLKDIKRLVQKDSIICFTGDLFHKKVELSNVWAKEALRLLTEINSLNIPTIIIDGTFSHDHDYINTLKESRFNNITFIQHTQELKFSNNLGETINILCIPEEYVEDQFEYYKSNVYNKKKVYDLVLMHGTFTDVLFHNVSIESETLRKSPKFDSKDFSRHTLTLSGHIHRHQILGKKKNVIYVGSYSNMNFGKDASANILSITLDKENKSFDMKVIENTSTHKFEDITIEDKDIGGFNDNLLLKFKNKPERLHYRVYMKSDDQLTINLLKDLKKDGYIKSLIVDKIEKEIHSKEHSDKMLSEDIDYTSIYTGKIEDQVSLFIKETYNVDMTKEKILEYLQ